MDCNNVENNNNDNNTLSDMTSYNTNNNNTVPDIINYNTNSNNNTNNRKKKITTDFLFDDDCREAAHIIKKYKCLYNRVQNDPKFPCLKKCVDLLEREK
jgi:hypothetical protein